MSMNSPETSCTTPPSVVVSAPGAVVVVSTGFSVPLWNYTNDQLFASISRCICNKFLNM